MYVGFRHKLADAYIGKAKLQRSTRTQHAAPTPGFVCRAVEHIAAVQRRADPAWRYRLWGKRPLPTLRICPLRVLASEQCALAHEADCIRLLEPPAQRAPGPRAPTGPARARPWPRFRARGVLRELSLNVAHCLPASAGRRFAEAASTLEPEGLQQLLRQYFMLAAGACMRLVLSARHWSELFGETCTTSGVVGGAQRVGCNKVTRTDQPT